MNTKTPRYKCFLNQFLTLTAKTWFLVGLCICSGCISIDAGNIFKKTRQKGPLDNSVSPKNAHHYFYNAKLAFEAGEFREAVINFKKALDIQPDFYAALMGLGHCYLEQHKPGSAIREYQKAMNLHRTPQVELSLARACFQMQKMPDSQQYAEKALSTHPQPAEVLELLGNIAYSKADYKKALEYWKEALDKDPQKTKLKLIYDDLLKYYQIYINPKFTGDKNNG